MIDLSAERVANKERFKWETTEKKTCRMCGCLNWHNHAFGWYSTVNNKVGGGGYHK